MSMKTKMFISITLLIIMTLTMLVMFDYLQTKNSILKNETSYYQLVNKTIENAFDSQINSARYSALSISENPDIQKTFAERNRAEIARLTMPIFNELKAEGISQLQFHIPPATAFYRAHKPDNYGDDLSSFRKTVVECNDKKRVVQGLEQGVGGFGFRVVVPINYQEIHMGSMEIGSDFGDAFAKNIQKAFQGSFIFIV
ncbi:hypothetical protein N752_27990 [Desulforamulus aquiferis]|nr:hypothetical protein N752_27990 [Desulforamulus aquiferis]